MGSMGSTYENELKNKVLSQNGFFSERSAGSLDTDLTIVYKGIGFIAEVKSSKKKKLYFSSDRLYEQLKTYIMVEDKFDVPVKYFYRWKTRKHMDLEDKWMVFGLDDFDTTNQGNPMLIWDNGIPIKKWMENVKKWTKKNDLQVVGIL